MKLKPFQQHLKKQNIDLVFLVHPDSNITYFTQMKPSYAHLIITPNSAEFHLTKLDQHPKLRDVNVKNIKKNWEKELENKKIKKVGINKTDLPTKFFEKLKISIVASPSIMTVRNTCAHQVSAPDRIFASL